MAELPVKGGGDLRAWEERLEIRGARSFADHRRPIYVLGLHFDPGPSGCRQRHPLPTLERL